jgi:hypothetical protein
MAPLARARGARSADSASSGAAPALVLMLHDPPSLTLLQQRTTQKIQNTITAYFIPLISLVWASS